MADVFFTSSLAVGEGLDEGLCVGVEVASAEETLLFLQLFGVGCGVEYGVIVLENGDIRAENIMCVTAIGTAMSPAILLFQIGEKTELE